MLLDAGPSASHCAPSGSSGSTSLGKSYETESKSDVRMTKAQSESSLWVPRDRDPASSTSITDGPTPGRPVMEPTPIADRPEVKRRACVLLIGLPLVAVALGVVLAGLLSHRTGFVLVAFGLAVSATNYRRLKGMSKASGDCGGGRRPASQSVTTRGVRRIPPTRPQGHGFESGSSPGAAP